MPQPPQLSGSLATSRQTWPQAVRSSTQIVPSSLSPPQAAASVSARANAPNPLRDVVTRSAGRVDARCHGGHVARRALRRRRPNIIATKPRVGVRARRAPPAMMSQPQPAPPPPLPAPPVIPVLPLAPVAPAAPVEPVVPASPALEPVVPAVPVEPVVPASPALEPVVPAVPVELGA